MKFLIWERVSHANFTIYNRSQLFLFPHTIFFRLTFLWPSVLWRGRLEHLLGAFDGFWPAWSRRSAPPHRKRSFHAIVIRTRVDLKPMYSPSFTHQIFGSHYFPPHPIYYIHPSSSCFLPSRESDPRWHSRFIAGSRQQALVPPQTKARVLHFHREKSSVLFSFVDSRRIVSTHAIISALDSSWFHLIIKKSTGIHYEIRTQDINASSIRG